MNDDEDDGEENGGNDNMIMIVINDKYENGDGVTLGLGSHWIALAAWLQSVSSQVRVST